MNRKLKRYLEEEEKTVAKIVELQEFYTIKDDPDSIKNQDSLFHQTIYSLSGSNAMRDTLSPLHRRLLKYRRVSVTVHSRAQKSLEEHQAICQAIAAHDGSLAEQLTIQHVLNARESILSLQRAPYQPQDHL